MANLSQVKVGSTTYDLKGTVLFVKGTQTAATGAWTGTLSNVSSLYTGLTIAYYLPYAGSGNATLNLTLDSGATGAINCYYQGNSRLTTHYGAGSLIMLTYAKAGEISVAGTATTDNRWIAGQNYADGNTRNTAGSTDTSSKIFLIGATSQAANPQTYSDDQVYVTSGTLQTNNTQATVNVCANTANSNSAGGLALYGTSPTDYGIAFRGTGNGGKHGGVQGDWAQYHYMTGATNRGWVFKHASSGNVASVDGVGNIVTNGAMTVGGNTTNTSGCKMQYNSTTAALDFIFS